MTSHFPIPWLVMRRILLVWVMIMLCWLIPSPGSPLFDTFHLVLVSQVRSLQYSLMFLKEIDLHQPSGTKRGVNPVCKVSDRATRRFLEDLLFVHILPDPSGALGVYTHLVFEIVACPWVDALILSGFFVKRYMCPHHLRQRILRFLPRTRHPSVGIYKVFRHRACLFYDWSPN